MGLNRDLLVNFGFFRRPGVCLHDKLENNLWRWTIFYLGLIQCLTHYAYKNASLLTWLLRKVEGVQELTDEFWIQPVKLFKNF